MNTEGGYIYKLIEAKHTLTPLSLQKNTRMQREEKHRENKSKSLKHRKNSPVKFNVSGSMAQLWWEGSTLRTWWIVLKPTGKSFN